MLRDVARNLSVGVAAIALAAGVSTEAQATQAPPVPADEASSDEAENIGIGNEEIVVTARRRAESIQSVPVAVTALGGAQLEAQGISNIEQIRTSTPALTVAPSNFGGYTPSYAIRAQRQGDGIITQDQSVGVYFSDVVQARPNGTNQSLYDIQSVQVVKGPQGTLFGRNTTGGAILITPNMPTDEFEGNLTGTVGNYGLLSISGAINVPVAEGFALRFAGARTRRDGYVKNVTTGRDLNDENVTAFRASALFERGAFENLTVFDFFRGRNGGTAHRIEAVNPNGSIRAFPALVTALQGSLARQNARSEYEVENDYATFNKAKVYGVANISTLDLSDAFGIKNIFGYRKINTDSATDWDGSSALAFHNRNVLNEKQLSNELQFFGKLANDRLSYIAGLYYFRESGHEFQPAFTLTPNVASREGDVVNLSRSVFAQFDFEILTGLTITAGVRQTWDKRDLTSYNRDTAAGGPALGRCRMFSDDAGTARFNPCVRVSPTAKFDALTYTIGANYKISSDIMVYASHNRGYRSGGQQFRANRPSETRPFGPEVVKNFEVGFKGDFFDRKLRLNVAAYHSDYQDIQRLLAPPCPPPNQTVVCSGIANAAKATVKGFEIEATIRPVDGIDIQAFYSLADAKYDRFVTPQGLDLSSKAFAGVPKKTYGATIGFDIADIDGRGDLRLYATYFHQSKVTLSDDNDEFVPGYGLVNAGFQWREVMDKPIDIRLYVNNLLNKSYSPGGIGIFPSFGFTSYQIGDPRNLGVSMAYRF